MEKPLTDAPHAHVASARKTYEPARLDQHQALTGDIGRKLRATRIFADLAVVALAHMVAWQIRFKSGLPGLPPRPEQGSTYAMASVISIVVLMALIAGKRLHDEDTLFRESGEFGRLYKAILQTMVVFPALAFLTQTRTISRSWMLLALACSVVFLSAERLAARGLINRARKRGHLRRPIIVIGMDERTEPAALGYEFEMLGNFSVEAGVEFLRSLVGVSSEERGARSLSVVVQTAGLSEDAVWRVLLHAGEVGAQVFVESPMRSVASDRLTVRPVGTRTVVRVSPPALSGVQAATKRTFDIAASAIGLLLLSPLIVLVSAAVMITSGRPIFYGQERIGRGGAPFKIWKFRSMKADSETTSGPVWASSDDPRRTPLGRMLRGTSLDELPQLWNVLRGQMSLVGPRPERPSFVEQFVGTIPWYDYRHRMLPGITGWAQAHGLRGNTSLEERVTFDNWYIEHWSIGLDLKICALTVGELIRGEHAY